MTRHPILLAVDIGAEGFGQHQKRQRHTMSVVASDQKLPSACSTLEARVSPKSRGWTCPACQRGLVGDGVLSRLL